MPAPIGTIYANETVDNPIKCDLCGVFPQCVAKRPKKALGTLEINVACIGPAGENLSCFACINADWSRNAGRTGIGAIMGAKNLKAIAARGAKDLPVHDLKGLTEEAEKAYAYMRNHKFFELW